MWGSLRLAPTILQRGYMNTLSCNSRIAIVLSSRPSSPRVHTKGDHVLEMRRASALDYSSGRRPKNTRYQIG